MGIMGFWQFLIALLYVVAIIYPVSIILRRIGFSPWWSLLAVVPVINLIMLWVLAYVGWPGGGLPQRPE
jgi:uncharacterized membrane protein YhaH (DUF805 family)